MKRFWLVLLSLGLVMAFSASAFAVDLKFSGSMYVAGQYLNKTSLADVTGTNATSTAMYFQRLRLRAEFVVDPSVSIITRFDVMERAWGAQRSNAAPTSASYAGGPVVPVMGDQSSGTKAENENIAFDQAYIMAKTPIGIISAGYIPDGMWGTMFMNSDSQAAKFTYTLPIGPVILQAQVAKGSEASYPYINATGQTVTGATDNDYDLYYLLGIYKVPNIEAGFLYMYIRNANPRPLVTYTVGAIPGLYQMNYHLFSPYAKLQLGPVYVEGEVRYNTGNYKKYDSGTGDVSYGALSGYVMAVATFGPVYFGGTFAYLSGDDPSTTDKIEGDMTGGQDWNPCLILWNYDRYTWAGTLPGNAGSTNSGAMANAWFYQVKGGVKPMDKLDINVSLSYATADKVSGTWVSKDYGYEIDVTGTYKITSNVSYMLGFGYLITGDYFKGTSATAAVANDYLVINKLTLTF